MSVSPNKVICELFIDQWFKPYALKVRNHANSNAVCGAMSSLILSTLNSIEQLIGIKQFFQINSGDVAIRFNLIPADDEQESRMVYVLLVNLVTAISSINEEYPDEISFYIRPRGAFEMKDPVIDR